MGWALLTDYQGVLGEFFVETFRGRAVEVEEEGLRGRCQQARRCEDRCEQHHEVATDRGYGMSK